MDNKESKKGFWSTLFAPKKKGCCSGNIIAEENIKHARSSDYYCCTTAPDSKVSEVLVIGPGCAKCKKTYSVVEQIISENNLDVRLSKIEDIAEMMKYNIMTTPAVVVNGSVIIKGHVPSADEVKKALGI